MFLYACNLMTHANKTRQQQHIQLFIYGNHKRREHLHYITMYTFR